MTLKIFVIILILIAVLAIFIAAAQGTVYHLDFHTMDVEREELELQLKSLKNNSQASQFLIRRIELSSNLQIELIRTNVRVGYADMDRLEKARAEIYNQNLHFNKTLDFFAYLDKELNNVHAKLMKNHSDLSLIQQQLCMLLLIQAPTNDIEMLLHYSPNSLPKIKTRLSKKLEVNGRNGIYLYLLDLISENIG